jgi:surfactin synthase thioesterase subunit
MTKRLLHTPRSRAEGETRAYAYCVAHAGAGAAAWNPVAAATPNLEIRAVRLPARESRIAQPAHPSLAAAAEEIAAAIVADPPPGELILAGSCFGALVALAVAGELAGRVPVGGLVLLRQTRPEQFDVGPSPLQMTSAELRDWLRAYRLTPASIVDDEQAMEFFEPTLLADLRAADGYRYLGPQLSCPIFLVGSRGIPPQADPALWRPLTTGAVGEITLDVPGDPLSDHPDQLAVLLNDLAARAETGWQALAAATVKEQR